MKNLEVESCSGNHGKVVSEAFMDDAGDFYCVVLCDGEFSKEHVHDLKLVKRDAESSPALPEYKTE